MQSQYRVRSLSPEVELMDVFLRIRVNHKADGRHRVDSRNESTLIKSETRLAPPPPHPIVPFPRFYSCFSFVPWTKVKKIYILYAITILLYIKGIASLD
jgi:hypothetical protein